MNTDKYMILINDTAIAGGPHSYDEMQAILKDFDNPDNELDGPSGVTIHKLGPAQVVTGRNTKQVFIGMVQTRDITETPKQRMKRYAAEARIDG